MTPKKTMYIALLRGINVGGNNIIKMTDLKLCFEEMGFSEVATYIQSGNVIFQAPTGGLDTLTKTIEVALSAKFRYKSSVVVITQSELKAVVTNAPPKFGKESDRYRYDVIFLKYLLTASEALRSVSTKEGVDSVHAGSGVLYFSRFIAKITQSHISRIVAMPVYKSMTIRNWNTTSKLLALLEK